jgi:hypothetical protein
MLKVEWETDHFGSERNVRRKERKESNRGKLTKSLKRKEVTDEETCEVLPFAASIVPLLFTVRETRIVQDRSLCRSYENQNWRMMWDVF